MVVHVTKSREMPAKPLHTFVYGALRTGKTSFAATFPRPIFLSAGNEGGDTTLRQYDVDIIQINSKKDMQDAIQYIAAHGAQQGWRTIVIDSVTYYSDLVLQDLTKDGTKPMQQRDWGLLDLHLQKSLLPTLRKMPFHVVWIALEELLIAGENVIGYKPMLYGKTAVKLPGACDLIVRAVTENVRDPATNMLAPQFWLRTMSLEGAPAGGRFGAVFQDGKIPAHFNVIAQRIGPYIGEEIPVAPAQAVAAP